MPKHADYTLVLGAHGSEAAPDSNAPVDDLANKIAQLDLFAHVTPAYLMGQPNMEQVLSVVPTEKVVVVPLMTSSGYYLNSVIPKKLAANEGAVGKQWFISPVAGMHPKIAPLMVDRITACLSEHDLQESETTIALIGHGTRRNKLSGKSTFALFEKLKTAFPAARNRVAFLDQDPDATLVAASVLEGHTIVVPFLVSRGPHTTVDVPEAFGLPSGPQVQFPLAIEKKSRVGIQKTICESPLAYYPEMADIVIELAETAIEKQQTLTLPELEVA